MSSLMSRHFCLNFGSGKRKKTMLDAMDCWEKLKIVFLVDVTAHDGEDLERFSRSLFLACIRILLATSAFPNKEHLKLQWSYLLFSSERPFKTLGVKTCQFYELHSEALETFMIDLTASISSESLGKIVTSPRQCQQLQVNNWARSLYNILAGAVQDFAWDAPDIKSPMCHQTRHGKQNVHNPVVGSKVSNKLNLIFIFSQEPWSVFANKGRAIVDKIFPRPLLSQLSCKKICVHWVYQGYWLDHSRLTVLAKTLVSTGGSLVPISALLPSTSDPSSNLVLPFLCFFKDLLESTEVKEHVREENILWFCSNGGQIICLLELNEVCKHQDRKGISEFLTRRERGDSIKPVHRDSLLEPLMPVSVPALGGSTSTFEGFNNAKCTHRPRVVILGAIISNSVPLQWLDFTMSYFCSSCHVPDKIRAKVMFARSDSPKKPTDKDSAPPCPDISSSPFTPPSLTSAYSLSSLPVGLSPQIQLNRSPISHRSLLSVAAHHRVSRKHRSSASKESRNRSTSVPDMRRKGRRQGKERMRRPSDIKKFNSILEKMKLGGLIPMTSGLLLAKECRQESNPSSPEPHFLDPAATLKERERSFHSREFQKLCIRLAKNRLQLLVKVVCGNDGTRYAVLQPTTSLVSTLNFVRPCYEHELNMSCAKFLLPIPTSPVLHLDEADNPRFHPVSRLEQFCNVHNPIISQSIKPAAETSSLLSALLHPSKELPNFSCMTLLPWYPYTQASAFRTSEAFQKFKECLVESGEEDLRRARNRAKLRMELMDELRKSYSGCDSFALGAPPSLGEDIMEDEVVVKEEEESLLHVPSIPRASSEKELIDNFWDKYEEFVSGSAEEIDVELLHKWVTSSMATLLEAFRNLIMEDSEDLLISKFWQVLESMSRSAQLSSQESKSREATECLLQVLMDLESVALCAGSVPTEALSFIAQKVIALLRRVTLYSGPALPVHFMQTLVMPAYIATCRGVLMEVCDSMMYPLPPDLQFPSSSPEGQESSDMEMEPVSLEEPLAPKAIGKLKQCFVRHRSFQEQSFTRQIMIPHRKKVTQKVMARKKVLQRLEKSPRSLVKVLPEVGRKSCQQRRRSVCRSLFSRSHTVSDIGINRLANTQKAWSEKNLIKLKKGNEKRSRRRIPHVLAKETPHKKQVEDYHKFKLERLRSKSALPCSPGVVVVEESPQRSFYSAPKRSWLTPKFKTPPMKGLEQTSPSLSLNKEPSPATIHSLLHDKFTPSATQKPIFTTPLTITQKQDHLANMPATSSTVDSFYQSFDDILSSEDMFESRHPELDGVVQQTPTTGCQLGFKPVRMLTYEEEKLPMQSPHKLPIKYIGTSTKSSRTPVKSNITQTKTLEKSKTSFTGVIGTPKRTPKIPIRYAFRTPIKFNRTPIKFNRTPLKSRRTPKWLRRKLMKMGASSPIKSSDHSTFHKDKTGVSMTGVAETVPATTVSTSFSLIDGVALISPPTHTGKLQVNSCPTAPNSCLLMDFDPTIAHDSASMVAFSLSTPTKEDPHDFHNAITESHDSITCSPNTN